jgi:hypothetical protein
VMKNKIIAFSDVAVDYQRWENVAKFSDGDFCARCPFIKTIPLFDVFWWLKISMWKDSSSCMGQTKMENWIKGMSVGLCFLLSSHAYCASFYYCPLRLLCFLLSIVRCIIHCLPFISPSLK